MSGYGGRIISAPTVLNEVSIEFVGAHYVRPRANAVRPYEKTGDVQKNEETNMSKRKNEDTEFLVQRTAHLMEVADKLLLRVEELTMDTQATPASLKTLSETLKNIRDAQMIKSRKDLQEQEVRIEKMKKDLSRDGEARGSVTVTLEAQVEAFSN